MHLNATALYDQQGLGDHRLSKGYLSFSYPENQQTGQVDTGPEVLEVPEW